MIYISQACRREQLKIILGIAVLPTSNVGKQVNNITTSKQWDLVEFLVVGNEALFNGYCSSEDLASYIISTKN